MSHREGLSVAKSAVSIAALLPCGLVPPWLLCGGWGTCLLLLLQPRMGPRARPGHCSGGVASCLCMAHASTSWRIRRIDGRPSVDAADDLACVGSSCSSPPQLIVITTPYMLAAVATCAHNQRRNGVRPATNSHIRKRWAYPQSSVHHRIMSPMLCICLRTLQKSQRWALLTQPVLSPVIVADSGV